MDWQEAHKAGIKTNEIARVDEIKQKGKMEHRLSSIEHRLDAIEEHLKRKRHTMDEEDVPAPHIRRSLPGMGNMTGVGDDGVRLVAEFLPHQDAVKLKDTSAILSAVVSAVPTYPLGWCLLMWYNNDPFANAVRDAAANIIGVVGSWLIQASLKPMLMMVMLEPANISVQSIRMITMIRVDQLDLFDYPYTLNDPTDYIRKLMDEPMIPEYSWSDVSPDVVDGYSRISAKFWCGGLGSGLERVEKVQNHYKSIQKLLKSTIVPQQNAKAKNDGLQFKFDVFTDLPDRDPAARFIEWVSLQYTYNRKNRGESLH